MYAPAPSQEELDFIGIALEDVQDNSVVGIWPENEAAVRLFSVMDKQWNVGMGGPVGLRYEVMPMLFRLLGIKRDEQLDVFDAVRIMEREALQQMKPD